DMRRIGVEIRWDRICGCEHRRFGWAVGIDELDMRESSLRYCDGVRLDLFTPHRDDLHVLEYFWAGFKERSEVPKRDARGLHLLAMTKIADQVRIGFTFWDDHEFGAMKQRRVDLERGDI